MQVQIPTREGAILGAKNGPAVDIFKMTQQGAALVRWRCLLGCTRCRCTLVQPGEYDWTIHMCRRYGLMSNYFNHYSSVLYIIIASRKLRSSPDQKKS